MNNRHDVQMAFVIGFFIVLTILGGIVEGAWTAHENNNKSRKIAVACVENHGTFRQGNQGEMTCDGIRK